MAIHGRERIMASSAHSRTQMKAVLAGSALLYRILWPFIDSYTPNTPQIATYSLLTKSIFVFISLSCFVSLFPALKLKRFDLHNPANQFAYYSMMVICLLVTTINYIAGWRWALAAIDEYFTRGYLFDDPSRFHRIAVVLCSCVITGSLLALLLAQWIRIGSHWREAQRALCLRATNGEDRQLGQTLLPRAIEKIAL